MLCKVLLGYHFPVCPLIILQSGSLAAEMMPPLSSPAWDEKNTLPPPAESLVSLCSAGYSSGGRCPQGPGSGCPARHGHDLHAAWDVGSVCRSRQLLALPATWEAAVPRSPGNAIGMSSPPLPTARSSIPAARPRAQSLAPQPFSFSGALPVFLVASERAVQFDDVPQICD